MVDVITPLIVLQSDTEDPTKHGHVGDESDETCYELSKINKQMTEVLGH